MFHGGVFLQKFIRCSRIIKAPTDKIQTIDLKLIDLKLID
jgi:hypothetical protein